MKNSEIKNLFTKADQQLLVDKTRKQKTYNVMIKELEKQKIPMLSEKIFYFISFITWINYFLLFMVLLFV